MVTTAVVVCGCGKTATPPRRGMCKACYEKRRIRQTAYGRWAPDRVDAGPVRAHVEELIAAGMSRRQICAAAGLDRKALVVIMRGKPSREPAAFVTRATADAFMAVLLPAVRYEAMAPHALVPAIGAQRRLRALVSAGWTMTFLAGELGLAVKNFSTMLHHQEQVTARRHRQVCVLFARLQMQPGPSRRARDYGRKRRWPLPFQWDEGVLDDPAAAPSSKARRESYKPRSSAA